MKFSLSSLLRSKPATDADTTPTSAKFKAPSGLSRSETKAWRAQAAPAGKLFEQLETEGKSWLGKHMLPPGSMHGVEFRPLAAHALSGTGNVLMTAPNRAEAHGWAHACLKHNIARVIDLRPPGTAGEPSCMDGGKSFQNYRGGLTARFRAINLRGPRSKKPAAQPEKHLGPHASETLVGVSMSKQGVVLNGDGQPAPGAELRLTWLRVPLKSGEVPSASRLKTLCAHLTTHRLEPGQHQAIQTAAGDRRAGVVLEAALMLHRQHRSGELLRATPEQAVRDACTRIGVEIGPLQLRQQELMTLLAFVQDLHDVPLNREGVDKVLHRRAAPPPPVVAQTPVTDDLPPPPEGL